MKVQPITSPANIPPQGTPESVRTARAVAAFNTATASPQRPQEHPVQNPNQVTVEELGAIQAPLIESPEDKQTVTEDTTQEPKPQDPTLTKQFAQLARQERALQIKARQQEQQWKAKEDAFRAKEAELLEKSKQYEQGWVPKERIKQDALTALSEAGVSYDDVVQQVLNQQAIDPRMQSLITKQETRIAQLEARLEESAKNQVNQQQQAYQAAVKQITTDVKQLVQTDPNFETIKETGSVKDVVELITKTYDKDGVLLTVEEAAQEVENYLVEEALKVTRIGKIKKRLEESNASAKQATQKTQATKQTQPTMKTLTNATSSTRQLSVRERSILAFKGELKP